MDKFNKNDILISSKDIMPRFEMPRFEMPKMNIGPSPETLKAMDEGVERKRKAQEAQVRTAQNTEDMKEQLDRVICNQNDYIELLKRQNHNLIRVLENIFVSSEDSAAVQKEILRIMQEQNVNEGLLKDKGMDVFIQGLFTCVNMYLASKGINL